jgi:hypothetical protein
MTNTLSPGRFCAAAYNKSNLAPPSKSAEDVLLIALMSVDRLEIRVRPDWQSQVRSQDRKFLSSFFASITRFAAEDPATALDQISSLSMGPMVTAATGEKLAEWPDLLRLWGTFAPAVTP